MDFPARLKLAREIAGYAKPIDAMRAFGFGGTYYQHENGNKRPSKEAIRRYSHAFRVSFDWLDEGIGAGPRGKKIADSVEPNSVAEIIELWEHVPDAEKSRAVEMLKIFAKNKR